MKKYYDGLATLGGGEQPAVEMEEQFWTGSAWWPTKHLIDGKVKPGTKTRIVPVPIEQPVKTDEKDKELELYKAKVEFYREATDKVREFISGRNDIGKPCQPLFDAIHDKLTHQQQEIERLKRLIRKAWLAEDRNNSTWQQFKTENNL